MKKMLGKHKNANKAKQTKESKAEKEPLRLEDFIPYACHFNKDTILTKNGELLKVIKITGFNFESVNKNEEKLLDIRTSIRTAIRASIKTNNFAIWIHTIRRRKNLSPSIEDDFDNAFCKILSKRWIKRNNWSHKYTNEVYISVMIGGQSLALSDVNGFFRSFLMRKELNNRWNFLEDSKKLLDEATDSLVEKLQDYGVKLLTITKINGIYYSDILKFFSKLVNFRQEEVPISHIDLSQSLVLNDIQFGNNKIVITKKQSELRNFFDIAKNKSLTNDTRIQDPVSSSSRNFASVFTIKETHDVPEQSLDIVLQLEDEFILSETFDFINRKKVVEHYQQHMEILRISGQQETLARDSGLKNILDSDEGSPTDYGEHQLTLVVIASYEDRLKKAIKNVVASFQKVGISIIQEDVFLEDCFWSVLPGNFPFIKRITPVNLENIGSYASLYNFPAGKRNGNKWGKAVTVFHTRADTPYFFNFHYEENGHTLILGPFGGGKTVLMNFLLSEAQKYGSKLFFLDQNRASEIFLRAIGGQYHTINSDNAEENLALNPLLQEETPANKRFIERWFEYLITAGFYPIDKQNNILIKKARRLLFSLDDKSLKTLSYIIPQIWNEETTSQQLEDLQHINASKEEGDSVDLEQEQKNNKFGDGFEEQDSYQDAEKRLQTFLESTEKDIESLLNIDDEERPASNITSIFTEQAFLLNQDEDDDEENQEDDFIRDFQNMPIIEKLAAWVDDGPYAKIFNHKTEDIDMVSQKIHGFDLTNLVQNKIALIPVVFYLFHKIFSSLDGKPAILVLDEAWSLIDNPMFTKYMDEWLRRLKEKNTIVIFATESIRDASKSSITSKLVDEIETKIFLPNPSARRENYQKIFGLSDKEFRLLSSMQTDKREFLLKHHTDAVIGKLNLEGMDFILSVLTSNQENISIMQTAIMDAGDKPEDWLPLYEERQK